MKQQIEVIVESTGEITIDAQGFSGMGCVKATEFLERNLGRLRKRRCKAAFHQTELRLPQQSLGQQNN